MSKHDFSYAESLCRQYKNQSGKKLKRTFPPNSPIPYWVQLIDDLVFGAGFSYSRIAYRIGVSASTIQKLATNPQRKPRLKVFHPLVALHCKVFQGQYVTPKAQEYWAMKCEALEEQIDREDNPLTL